MSSPTRRGVKVDPRRFAYAVDVDKLAVADLATRFGLTKAQVRRRRDTLRQLQASARTGPSAADDAKETSA